MLEPEEQLALEGWSMLQDLKREQLYLANEPQSFRYSVKSSEEAASLGLPLDPDRQLQLLEKLARNGSFTIDLIAPGQSEITKYEGFIPLVEQRYMVVLKQPKFDNMYEEYRERAKQLHSVVLESTANQQPDKITVQLLVQDNKLYLKADGKLHRIKKFQANSTIESLMNFVVNSRPNTTIELTDYLTINQFAGDVTSFSELIRMANLKPLINIFIVELQPRNIKVVTMTEMSQQELSQLIDSFL